MYRRRCEEHNGCTAHDHGNCRHCGVRLSVSFPAWSFEGDIWICEACYSTVTDTMDEALDTTHTHTWDDWHVGLGGSPAYVSTYGQIRHCTTCRAFQWRTVDQAGRVLDTGRIHAPVTGA